MLTIISQPNHARPNFDSDVSVDSDYYVAIGRKRIAGPFLDEYTASLALTAIEALHADDRAQCRLCGYPAASHGHFAACPDDYDEATALLELSCDWKAARESVTGDGISILAPRGMMDYCP